MKKPSIEDIRKAEKEFTDRGLLIEAGFAGFKLMAVPATATAQQLEDVREVFFAGALHLFQSIMSVMEPDAEPTENDLARMGKIQAELDRFHAVMKQKYNL